MRQILEVTGKDSRKFLNDLITNSLPDDDHIAYSALLTAQGKFLVDFFVISKPDAIWIDVAREYSDDLTKRLNLYRLRADVEIKPLEISVSSGLDDPGETDFLDPRARELGWRRYDTGKPARISDEDWMMRRIMTMVPELGKELIPQESYILEMGFERLSGVDFQKGCYVGQEVTARMKHKTQLRKGLARIQSDAPLNAPSEIFAGEKKIGQVTSALGTLGLAYIRFDRADQDLHADGVGVTIEASDFQNEV